MDFSSYPLFLTVQPGFEDSAEADLFHRFPGSLRIEALPGWRVFHTAMDSAEGAPTPFARAWGRLLEGDRDPWLDPATRDLFASGAVHLHCWSRREFPPGAREKRPVLIDVERKETELREKLRGLDLRLVEAGIPPRDGELILNAIRVQPKRWAWGLHRHSADRVAYPGGEYPWPPQAVPSRAYVKCQEGLAWARTRLSEGEQAIELGCAPGGSLLALLEHGLDVVGVDPGEVDPAVVAAARTRGRRFAHLRRLANQVGPPDFPAQIDWLFSDMNVAPEELLAQIAKWLPELRVRGLREAFLTLKLTDLLFVHGLREIPDRIRRDWSARDAKLKQLSQNRREILLHVTWETGLNS